jgi:hypothetical protein
MWLQQTVFNKKQGRPAGVAAAAAWMAHSVLMLPYGPSRLRNTSEQWSKLQAHKPQNFPSHHAHIATHTDMGRWTRRIAQGNTSPGIQLRAKVHDPAADPQMPVTIATTMKIHCAFFFLFSFSRVTPVQLSI